jgi:hypothetical protein
VWLPPFSEEKPVTSGARMASSLRNGIHIIRPASGILISPSSTPSSTNSIHSDIV